MVAHKVGTWKEGYNSISEQHGIHSEMLMDFGVLILHKGSSFTCSLPMERAFLLIDGEVEFQWESHTAVATRFDVLTENPYVLHVPEGVSVTLIAMSDCELCIQRKENNVTFPSHLFVPQEIKSERTGEDLLDGASARTVRTVFDGESHPHSQMVLGETINTPGRWTSFPPHDHPHPEMYHYRFFPKDGFGISLIEESPYLIKDGDTSLIPPHNTHIQVSAPSYTMYYIWAIAHLEDDRWLPTTRFVRKEYLWMVE